MIRRKIRSRNQESTSAGLAPSASNPEGFAESLRRAADPNGLLTQPANYAVDLSDGQMLMRWGIFNPAGPTDLSVTASPAAATSESIVVFHLRHPMLSRSDAVGIIPDESIESRDQLLAALFARNGAPDEGVSFVGSLPSYVCTRENYPRERAHRPMLSGGECAELFWAVLPMIDADDLEQLAALRMKNLGDPWASTKNPFEQLLGALGEDGDHPRTRRGRPSSSHHSPPP